MSAIVVLGVQDFQWRRLAQTKVWTPKYLNIMALNLRAILYIIIIL
jgi:hypothetical protein